MNSLEVIAAGVKKLWPQQLLKDGVIHTRLIWLGLLGILLLVFGGILDNLSTQSKVDIPPEIIKNTQSSNTTYEEILENKLSMMLTKVKGAGNVVVHITLENGSVQEHAKNLVKESKVVQEKDTSGGIRTTTETKESEQILLGKENGVDRPVLVQEKKPLIKGVLVIAEGAYDSSVKANLTQGVEAGLGVPSYRITVLTQGK